MMFLFSSRRQDYPQAGYEHAISFGIVQERSEAR